MKRKTTKEILAVLAHVFAFICVDSSGIQFVETIGVAVQDVRINYKCVVGVNHSLFGPTGL